MTILSCPYFNDILKTLINKLKLINLYNENYLYSIIQKYVYNILLA